MSEETKWAVEWKDGLGRSRWQPIFPNGQRLWWRERDLSAEWRYSNDAGLPPRVYRFRWRAVRVAKARWGERQAEDLKEVGRDDL